MKKGRGEGEQRERRRDGEQRERRGDGEQRERRGDGEQKRRRAKEGINHSGHPKTLIYHSFAIWLESMYLIIQLAVTLHWYLWDSKVIFFRRYSCKNLRSGNSLFDGLHDDVISSYSLVDTGG